ncbi:NAD(P)/FAD-dependent oxidoreductase [Siminovitchia sediminis]|uniref:Ferredoxin--NADP reductase n=1 Tax=Siminovitchia sediminis TaxID=1274353 RepID=A0ABW4KEM8_9BACI
MPGSYDDKLYDVTIIGSGPVGLFTAFYAGMRQMSVKIIESLPQLGGQLSALYPEKYIYDVAGFPKILANELVENLKEQAFQFNPAIVLNETVADVQKLSDDTFHIEAEQGNVHRSKSIIITAGCGAFQPRKLEAQGADQYEERNVSYYIDDLASFSKKKVAVLGGGDSAVDWALMLEPLAEKVTIIHRRDKFRAHEHSTNQLYQSTVDILAPCAVKEVIGDGNKAKGLLLEQEGMQFSLEVDEVVVNYGFISSLGHIKNWGLNIEKNSIVVNSKMETNIEGIYAAGDIITYDGKIKLIVNGFGDATTAVSHAKAYIEPNTRVLAPHSTNVFEKVTKEFSKIDK